MSHAEDLEKQQPGEILVDGTAHYDGTITATTDEGVLLGNCNSLLDIDGEFRITPGAQVDLQLSELFDSKGAAMRARVTVADIEDRTLTLLFNNVRDQKKFLVAFTPDPPPNEYNADDVLRQLRGRALLQITAMLEDFLPSLVDHLFDTSASPQSATMQDLYYEAMNVVKRNQIRMREDYAASIDIYFDQPEPDGKHKGAVAEDAIDARKLGLVDLKDFEDELSLDRAIKRGQQKYAVALECLLIRYAELVGREPQKTRSPLDVRQLCGAWRTALDGQNVPHEAAPEIYSFFAANFIDRLEKLYSSLNVYLRELGVRPELEAEVEKHGSLLKRKPRVKKARDTSSSPETREPEGEMVALAEEAARLQMDAKRSGFDLSANAGAQGASQHTSQSAPAPRGQNTGATPFTGGASQGNPQATPGGAAGEIPPGTPRGARQGASGGDLQGVPAGGARGAPQSVPQGEEPAGPASANSPLASEQGSTSITEDTVSAIRQQFRPDNLYRSVVDALNFKRGTQAQEMRASGHTGPIQDGTAPEGATAADTTALANALSALQHDTTIRSEVGESASLREFLSENQQNIEPLQGTTGFEPESLSQLELVDNLFSRIKTDVDVAPVLRPALGDLQIPLAKLAVLEPQFFQEKNHPARGVVDKVAQLASSANYPNKPLETKVSGIIDNIVENYKTDSSVFESALSSLDKLVNQQQVALERNVERVVKTQDGQEKLRKANEAVAKVLQSRIRPPHAPTALVDLVDNGWRDLLTITHIKEGPNSRSWKDYVKTLDLLSLWLLEQSQAGEEMKVERALEGETFIDMVRQQLANGLPSHVAHEPVLDNLTEILSGRSDVEQSEIEPYEQDTRRKPADIRKKVDSLPRLRRWVTRVEKLKTGTWLTYKDKEGAKRRMQLAWVSEDKDRYIFVNERGQKLSALSNIELARQLSRGVQPPKPSEDLSLVDQSMYTTLEHVHKSLSFAGNYDSITKLINKKTFMAQLQKSLEHAKSKHAEHGMLLLDIDNFSLVNELYDEVTGDQILAEFGKLLAQVHDADTSSSRMDGDQFGILLRNRSPEQSVVIAEAIRREIEEESIGIEADQVSFTVSMGVTNIVDMCETVEDIIENAQTAVRKAKEDGRNRVVQFHEDQHRAEQYASEEREVRAEIEKTLETDKFALRAQPIVRASSEDHDETVGHYEILLAIKDGDELKSPQDFIINAERYGYMSDVDRWVVRQVFIWINQLMDEEKEIPYLAINLSGNSVTDDSFMEYLFEQISEYGVGTDRICFEITETGTISNLVKAGDFVREFKNIGCKFSIDDFGTGLASHSYLRELPVDYIKIDGSFVATLHTNETDYAMVKSINDLAHFLGQETIAEFVENDEIIEKLQEIGVDYLQGWGIGKPVPLADLKETLNTVEK